MIEDCEMLGHPNVTGMGCPCGLIVRRMIRPAPYPVPVVEVVEPWVPPMQLVGGPRHTVSLRGRSVHRARRLA